MLTSTSTTTAKSLSTRLGTRMERETFPHFLSHKSLGLEVADSFRSVVEAWSKHGRSWVEAGSKHIRGTLSKETTPLFLFTPLIQLFFVELFFFLYLFYLSSCYCYKNCSQYIHYSSIIISHSSFCLSVFVFLFLLLLLLCFQNVRQSLILSYIYHDEACGFCFDFGFIYLLCFVVYLFLLIVFRCLFYFFV